MPVRFVGKSEYNHSYQWNDIFRPTPETVARPAGLPSATVAQKNYLISLDGSKKFARTAPAPVSRSPIHGDPEWDPYVLLGNQNKFSSNVAYRTIRSRSPSQNRTSTTQTEAVRPPPLPEKPSNRTFAVHRSRRAEKPEPAPNTPLAPRERRLSLEDELKLDVGGEAAAPEPAAAAEAGEPPSPPPPLPRREPRVRRSVEEMAQTDDYYAKRRQLGIERRVPLEAPLNKQTEYSVQYDWKRATRESPLLNANDSFIRSHASAFPRGPIVKREEAGGRVVSSTMPLGHNTEYRRAYARLPRRDIQVADRTRETDARLVRSRSLEELHRPPQEAVEPVVNISDRTYKVRDLLRPEQVVAPPTRGRARFKTEYRSRFKSPLSFSYDRGTWRRLPTETVPQDPRSYTESSWFQELLELRRRAQQYRERSWGTHFSNSHTLQLVSRRARLWDEDEESVQPPPEEAEASAPTAEAAVEADEGEGHPLDELATPPVPPPRAPREPVPEPEGASEEGAFENLEGDADGRWAYVVPRNTEGRMPTPRIGLAPRHHNDRTTPNVGGAILVAPPSPPPTPPPAASPPEAQRKPLEAQPPPAPPVPRRAEPDETRLELQLPSPHGSRNEEYDPERYSDRPSSNREPPPKPIAAPAASRPKPKPANPNWRIRAAGLHSDDAYRLLKPGESASESSRSSVLETEQVLNRSRDHFNLRSARPWTFQVPCWSVSLIRFPFSVRYMGYRSLPHRIRLFVHFVQFISSDITYKLYF